MFNTKLQEKSDLKSLTWGVQECRLYTFPILRLNALYVALFYLFICRELRNPQNFSEFCKVPGNGGDDNSSLSALAN